MKLKYLKVITLISTIIIGFNTHSQTAIKRVLVEEYTGVWCSSCAFGNVYFEYLETNYPNAIPLAIHSGDIMENFSISGYMTDYFDALPTFLFDRVDFPTNPEIVPAVSAYPWPTGLDTLDHYLDMVYNQAPLATIGIEQTYNPVTREITATITSNFVQDATGDFRLNCFILEDSVSGGDDYNQSNSNFSGWTGGPAYLQDLINSPAIITGYNHNHVVREMLGTPTGVLASIPVTVANGSSYSKTFNYTLPAAYDEDQISLVGVIQRYGSNLTTDRTIVNANSQHLGTQTNSIYEIDEAILNVSIYPNPIEDHSKIEFYVKKSGTISCSLYNSLGQQVSKIFNEHFVQGEYRIDLNQYALDSGIYYLIFSQNQDTQTEKISVR